MSRQPVVGVMGGGQADVSVEQTARQLGAAIARRGWVLVNGGRAAGVMAASAAGARREDGLVVGVLPSAGPEDPAADVAKGVDVAVFTDMGEARNNVNVLTADVVVALPGGSGTLSEAALAVKDGTPLVLLGWSTDAVPAALADEAHRPDTVEAAVATVEALVGD